MRGRVPAVYSFDADAGQDVVVRLSQRDRGQGFDPYLRVFGPDGFLVGEDDDSAGNLDSRIFLSVASTGTYRVEASGLGDSTGRFWLAVVEPGAEAGLGVQFEHGGDDGFDPGPRGPAPFDGHVEERGQIALGEVLRDEIIASRRGHLWLFEGEAGARVVVVVRRAGELDPVVELHGPDGRVLATDDDGDGAGDLNSRIGLVLPESGTYRIVTYGLGDSTGVYDLAVTEG